MREIKFRFWDNCIKHMYYNDKIDECNNELTMNWYSITKDGLIAGNVVASGMNNYDLEIMQYTGLKDENNREIYEGDIIKLSNELYGIIEFNEEGGYFGIRYIQTVGCDYVRQLGTWIKNYKIIGNIHENQELLNK